MNLIYTLDLKPCVVKPGTDVCGMMLSMEAEPFDRETAVVSKGKKRRARQALSGKPPVLSLCISPFVPPRFF